MSVDLSKIAPMTEREAEELYQRTVIPTYADVECALNDLPKPTGDIVRRYIAHQQQKLINMTRQASDLSRAQYRPGYGEMGG